MEIVDFGPVQVKILKGGFVNHWRLVGEKKWRKLPMPEDLVLALETEEFFNHTLPDMVKIGKIFGL